MDSRINHKNIVTKKNRLSNLFYVRQAVASATFFMPVKQSADSASWKNAEIEIL